MMLEQYYRQLASGERRGVLDRLLVHLVSLLAIPYAVVMRFRALFYDAGIFPKRRLPRPVISVGNITVGGTGKTPMTAMLARMLMERGLRVAVLSRGYGGSAKGAIKILADGESVIGTPEEVGDEPYLLATTVPGLIVVIGADRHGAGMLAMEKFAPDIFILDDGFQHLRLHRDLNLLLLDSRRPFGNGHAFPAGLLREPLTELGRADLLVMTRWSGEELPESRGKAICRAVHHLAGLQLEGRGDIHSFTLLQGRKGMALAGIADPGRFFSDLGRSGLELSATLPLPDHCAYGATEVESIERMQTACCADFLVTTGKDWVKLSRQKEKFGEIYVAALEMKILDREPLDVALDKLLSKGD